MGKSKYTSVRLVCFLFFLTLFKAHANEPMVAVVIYDGENHTGDSIEIKYNTSSLGEMNNKMTSFKVTPGFMVRFYENENFTGRYYTKKSNASEAMKVAYSDKIESVEILIDGTPEAQKQPVAVTIYDEQNHAGTSLEIRYDTPSFGTMNKKLSSFKLSQGAQVRFFSNENYQGQYFTRSSNMIDGLHAKSFDNKVSSVRILRAPNPPVSTARLLESSPTNVEGFAFYEIELDDTTPYKLSATRTNPEQTEEIAKPLDSDLNANMYIEEGRFFNKTSLIVEEFFVNNNYEMVYVELSDPIPAYSSAFLGEGFVQAKLVKMTTLGNNKLEFGQANSTSMAVDINKVPTSEADTLITEENPSSVSGSANVLRRLNAVERAAVEKIQNYQKIWTNAPNTLETIIGFVLEHCQTGTHFANCQNANDTPERYAQDMYFSQSVSNVHSQLWAKSKVWGASTSAGLEVFNTERPKTVNIWLNPLLIEKLEDSNVEAAKEGHQKVINKYYHNIGLDSSSGWLSSGENKGVDSLFAELVVNDYEANIGDKYLISNLAIFSKMIDKTTYEFEVFSNQNVSSLTLRLLSTRNIDVKIFQANSNKFIVKFDQLPQTDVYVSLFSPNSRQMASVAIDQVTSLVADAVYSFNDNIESLLKVYNGVHVAVDDKYWIRNFFLPKDAPNGAVVSFSSSSKTFSQVSDRRGYHRLDKGGSLSFERQGANWIKLQE